ncbi:MAG: hypothetical protein Q8L90_10775 [Bacteroidota bacterium]|nr:hypothetical protein [Bacteroidota bacterium]
MKTNTKSNEMQKIFLARALQEKNGCFNCGRSIIDSFYQKKNKQYVCQCLFNVNPMSSTPMHKSHIPLEIWFELIKDIITSDTGVDSKYVEDKYLLSTTSAWNILYKIREWINVVEESENCVNQSKFVKYLEKLETKYFFKYNQEIPPKQMQKKMLNALPPLFNHLRGNKLAT